MVETIQSESFEREMRKRGHEFEQAELVSKERVSKILNGAAKPCTVECWFNGDRLEWPLSNPTSHQVYMNIVRLINAGEVRGLQVKDG